MATELADSMDVLTDADAWTSAAVVGGGYAGSAIVDSLITGIMPGPDEAAGLVAGAGVAAGGYAYGAQYSSELVTGGLLFSIGSAAEYFGFKETVMDLGSDL